MAVQIIRVRYIAETDDLLQAESILRSQAAAAGVAESEVSDLNRQYAAQAKQVRNNTAELLRMEREAERLGQALDKAVDPADQDKLQKELDETRKKMAALRKETEQTGDSAEKGLGGLGRVLEFAAGSVLGGALIGVAQGLADGAIGFAQSAIQAAAAFEQTVTSFKVLVGSAEKAKQVLNDLEEFSVETPFTSEEVQSVARQLLAFGVSTDRLIDTLRRLGDVSAGTNTSLGDLAFVYGQIRTQQTAYTQDLLQFAGRGIPIFEILAQNLNTTSAGVKDLAIKGKIGFAEIEQAFVTLTSEGGKFFNLTNAQSQTLNGRISTLEDNFQVITRTLGQYLLPIAKRLTDTFIRWFDLVREGVTVQEDAAAVTAKQQASVNGLVGAITDANTSEEVRLDLITQLKREYPGFLSDLDSEKITNEQILERLKDVNDEYLKRIILQKRQAEVESSLGAQADAFLRQTRAVRGLSEAAQGAGAELAGIQVSGDGTVTFDNLGANIDKAKAKLEELRGQLSSLPQGSTTFVETNSQVTKLTLAIAEVGAATEQYNKISEENTGLSAENIQILKELDGLLDITGKKPIVSTAGGKTPKELAAEARALKNELAELAKIKDIKVKVEIEQAGGLGTVEGIRLLEEYTIEQIKSSDIQKKLRVKDEQIANERILQERVRFSQRVASVSTSESAAETNLQKELSIIRNTEEFKRLETSRQDEILLQVIEAFGLRKIALQTSAAKTETEIIKGQIDIQKEEYSKQLTAASISLQQREIESVRRLARIANIEKSSAEERTAIISEVSDERVRAEITTLIEEKKYAEARKLLEEDVALSKIDSQRQFLTETRRLAEEQLRIEEAAIERLKAKVSTGTATAPEQAEFTSRAEAAQRLKDELLRIEKELTEGIISEADARASRLKAIDNASAQDRISNVQAILGATQQILGATADFFEAQKQRELEAAQGNDEARAEIEKRAFKRQKAYAIANAVISGAQAVLSVLAAVPGPLDLLSLGVARVVMIGATIAATGLQIAAIASAKPPGFRDGVFELQGPGSETSDSIPARLSRNETVIPAAIGREYRPAVKAIFDKQIPAEKINEFVLSWNKGRGTESQITTSSVVSAVNSTIASNTIQTAKERATSTLSSDTREREEIDRVVSEKEVTSEATTGRSIFASVKDAVRHVFTSIGEVYSEKTTSPGATIEKETIGTWEATKDVVRQIFRSSSDIWEVATQSREANTYRTETTAESVLRYISDRKDDVRSFVSTREIERTNTEKERAVQVETIWELIRFAPSTDYRQGEESPIRLETQWGMTYVIPQTTFSQKHSYEAIGRPETADRLQHGININGNDSADTRAVRPQFIASVSMPAYNVLPVVDAPVSVSVDVGELRQDMQGLRSDVAALASRIALENDTRLGQRIKILDQTIFDYLVKKGR